jgi:6-phosphogluconolactonase
MTTNQKYRTVILETADMAEYMLTEWNKLVQNTLSVQRYFSVALSGGRTPRDFYSRLSTGSERDIWVNIHVFLADERYVLLSNPDSTYGMLKQLLLDRVGLLPGNRHPVPVEEKTLESAAKKYEEEIRNFFRLDKGAFPKFDLIMLGMGEDGHTASLFPNNKVLKEGKHLACPVTHAPNAHDRITLTLPVINNARHIIFYVSGAGKAEAVKKVLERRDPSLPSSHVKPFDGDLNFVLDTDAASQLTREKTMIVAMNAGGDAS